MSNKLAIAAVALMAISVPSAAQATSKIWHYKSKLVETTHTEYSRDCAKGGNSAARGSIYNMAGPCASVSREVKDGDVCYSTYYKKKLIKKGYWHWSKRKGWHWHHAKWSKPYKVDWHPTSHDKYCRSKLPK
jgi:hypothetical protein